MPHNGPRMARCVPRMASDDENYHIDNATRNNLHNDDTADDDDDDDDDDNKGKYQHCPKAANCLQDTPR